MKSNLSKAEMLELSNTPDLLVQWKTGDQVTCSDDGNIYILDKSATASETTGKFLELGGSVNSLPTAVAVYNGKVVYNLADNKHYECVPVYTCTVGGKSNVNATGQALVKLIQYLLPSGWEDVHSISWNADTSTSVSDYIATLYTLTGSQLLQTPALLRTFFTDFGVTITVGASSANVSISDIAIDSYRWKKLEPADQLSSLPNPASTPEYLGKLTTYTGSATSSAARNIGILPGTIFKTVLASDGYSYDYTPITQSSYKTISLGVYTESSSTETWFKLTLSDPFNSGHSLMFAIMCGRNTVGILTAPLKSASAGGAGILHMLHQGTSGSSSDYIRISNFKWNNSKRIFIFKVVGGGYVTVSQLGGWWNNFTLESSATEPTDNTYTVGTIMLATETVYTQS